MMIAASIIAPIALSVPRLLEIHWSAVLNLQTDVVEILQPLDIPAASDEKLGRRNLERFAADILIAHPDRINDISDRNVVSQELIRIEIDLVLFDEPADWRDLGDTFHRLKSVPDVPILERP